MKKSNIIFKLIFLSFLISIVSTPYIYAQKDKGNKDLKKEVREVESFNKIIITTIGTTYLSQGEKESVTIETESKLLKHIIVEVKDNTLHIKNKKKTKIKKKAKLKIYIQLKDINQLTVNAIGNVKCTNPLKLDKVEIKNSGVGNLTLNGEANEVNIDNTGVGNVNAFDFVVKKMNVKNTGIGNVKVNVSDELSIKNSGVGNIKYKGDAVIKEINASGIGSVSKKKD